MRITISRRGVVAAAVFVALGVAAGIGYAATTSTSNVINACVKNGGQVRILDANDSCKKEEQPLSWNVQGPPGVPGQPGSSSGVRIAYARLLPDGTFDPTRSFGVVGVSNFVYPFGTSARVFCLDLAFAPRWPSTRSPALISRPGGSSGLRIRTASRRIATPLR